MWNTILHVMPKSDFSHSSKGGADSGEMCSEHHCSRFGASLLRPGNGPCAPLHDEEGSHQHWSAGCEKTSASRTIRHCKILNHEVLLQIFCNFT